ncbi:MAG TPA: hypothetical protein VEC37_03745, partial [Bacillota bacterium]|nr:hypothetical protein [Bacillota bacterium]
CGKPVFEGEKSFYCSGYKAGCKFSVFKSNSFMNCFGAKEVSKSLVQGLLAADDLQSTVKLGTKIFGVRLVQSEAGYYNLAFDKANAVSEALGQCPECGRDVVETKKGFGCSGYRDSGCKFALWKEDLLLAKYGKIVTAKMAKDFLTNRVTKVKGLVDPKDQTKFDGELELYKNSRGYWGFKITREQSVG